jgi:hypothetical protein
MARVTPILRSFNAGEWSPLVEGRTDIDRYASSMKKLRNFVVTQQGPIVRRSGTIFTTTANKNNEHSEIIPFIFGQDQALLLEFGDETLRFISDGGLLTYAAVAVTAVGAGTPLVITSASLGANVGDQVVLGGFAAATNLNGRVANITAKVSNDYTLDLARPAGTISVVSATAARVYAIASPYTETDTPNLRYLQDADLVFLFCEGFAPYVLSRFSNLNWTLELLDFSDGPYMDVNATETRVSITTNTIATPIMTSINTPSGAVAVSTTRAGTQGYFAFDQNRTSAWQSDTKQYGWLRYWFGASGKVIDGYMLYGAQSSENADYTAKDYSPGSWMMQGSDDATNWTTLHEVQNYQLWDKKRTEFFEFANTYPFEFYRIEITESGRNGDAYPVIHEFIMREAGVKSVTATFSSTTGINRNTGFQSTDVGRLLRVRDSRSFWHALKITSVTNTTTVVCDLLDDPFLGAINTTQWRLGLFSDTTGWPTCGTFFDDRLYMAGAFDAPTTVAASTPGSYTNFAQTDKDGTVNDDNALVFKIKARKIPRVAWMATDERGLLIGTGAGEFVVTAATSGEAITARSVKARNSTARGSAPIEPVKIDRALLYVQRSQRTVRELAYVFEADGYRSPSMSLFASHLGEQRFVELDYAAEPHSVCFIRREDGLVAGLTYNREENVIGWHLHDVGGFVESMAVLPNEDGKQDSLWLVVRRTVNSQTVRYIERLADFWDFGNTLADDAWFVDCGARYDGELTDTLAGLWFLEGKTVYGLADGLKVGPLVVTNGAVTLGYEAESVVLGLPFESIAETARIDAGGSDGTSQGKTKRIHGVNIRVWDTLGGKYGRYDQETGAEVWEDIGYRLPDDYTDVLPLFTGDLGKVSFPAGYDTDGRVVVSTDDPYPLNLVALMPQLSGSDG